MNVHNAGVEHAESNADSADVGIMRVASKDERIAELEDKVEELEGSIDSLRETVEMQQAALDQVSKDWLLVMEYLRFVSILSPSRLATEQ